MPDNYISISAEKGSINVSEEVIAIIAGAAISETEGVAGLSNSVGSEIYEFIGRKSVTKGIKVSFDENKIIVDATIMVRFGATIATIAEKVQNSVASAVENMTGIAPVVNIRVAGISFDK